MPGCEPTWDATGVAGQDDKAPLFRAADGKRR
jgi:hypothetical protein